MVPPTLPLRLDRLTLCQDLFDAVLDFASPLQPEHSFYPLAIAADIKGCGQELYSTVRIAHRFLAHQNGIIYSQVVSELADLLRAGIVHGDAKNLHSLRPVPLL